MTMIEELKALAQKAPELFAGISVVIAVTVMGFALRRMIHYW